MKLKPQPIDGGALCPKCAQPMQRYAHAPRWQPKPGRCFYAWWDTCKPCKHMQHYSDALRPPTDDSDRSRQLADWIERKRDREREGEVAVAEQQLELKV
jgi:hypothetical protein